MVDQALHEHAAALPAAGHANRSRRLIKCAKDSGHYRRVTTEAAECMDVSPGSAVKWLQRWQETGSVAAKPTEGSISRLEGHADWLLALIAKQPDFTLNEIVVANARATD